MLATILLFLTVLSTGMGVFHQIQIGDNKHKIRSIQQVQALHEKLITRYHNIR